MSIQCLSVKFRLFLVLINLTLLHSFPVIAKQVNKAFIDNLISKMKDEIIKHSPEIKLLKEDKGRKKEQYRASIAGFFPQLTIDLYRQWRQQSPRNLRGVDFNLDLPLYRRDYFVQKNLSYWEIGQANEQEKLLHRTTEQFLIDYLANFFLTQYQRKIFWEQRRILQLQIRQHEKKYQLREMNKYEYLVEKSELDILDTKIELAEQGQEQINEGFYNQTGLSQNHKLIDFLQGRKWTIDQLEAYIHQVYQTSFSMCQKQDPLKMDPQQIKESLSPNNLWIRSIEMGLEVEKSVAERFTQDDYPSVNILGKFSKQEPNSFINSVSNNQSLGIFLKIPFSTGGRLFFNRGQKAHAITTAKINAHNQKQTIINVLKTSIKNYASLQRLLRVQESYMQKKKKTKQLMSTSYHLGKVPINDYFKESNEFLDSRVEYFKGLTQSGILKRRIHLYLDCQNNKANL